MARVPKQAGLRIASEESVIQMRKGRSRQTLNGLSGLSVTEEDCFGLPQPIVALSLVPPGAFAAKRRQLEWAVHSRLYIRGTGPSGFNPGHHYRSIKKRLDRASAEPEHPGFHPDAAAGQKPVARGIVRVLSRSCRSGGCSSCRRSSCRRWSGWCSWCCSWRGRWCGKRLNGRRVTHWSWRCRAN